MAERVLKSPLRRFANAFVLALNLIVAVGMFVTAYAGTVSPIEHPLMGVIVLSFPVWLAAMVLLLVADLIWWRRTSLIAVAGIAAAWPMVWNICPMNVGADTPAVISTDRLFTLLTYNVMNFTDQNGAYAHDINPTISYILEKDADIVCLQEAPMLDRSDVIHLHQAQLDSVHARYPYVVLSGHSMAILSKFPVTNLHLAISDLGPQSTGDMAAYTIDVEGRRLAVFSVHLQSYSLNANDKESFVELTRLKPDEDNVRDLKNSMLQKLESAAVLRALQAQELARYVDYYGGENVIVCGDFNDVPGCYTLRTLEEHGLREVWPAVAFGPTVTFNADRFYFRIDHLLWRGCLRPVSISRGNVKCSDHYPLLTTFMWD